MIEKENISAINYTNFNNLNFQKVVDCGSEINF